MSLRLRRDCRLHRQQSENREHEVLRLLAQEKAAAEATGSTQEAAACAAGHGSRMMFEDEPLPDWAYGHPAEHLQGRSWRGRLGQGDLDREKGLGGREGEPTMRTNWDF